MNKSDTFNESNLGCFNLPEILVELLSVNVTGNGIVAEMCRELVEIFKPMVKFYDVNLQLCLPHPHQPDYCDYLKIGALVVTTWMMLLLEPFGLRLRSVIMDHYYPERCLERTVWLYHHILRKRMSFIKFAWNSMIKEVTQTLSESIGVEKMTCMEIFRAKIDR